MTKKCVIWAFCFFYNIAFSFAFMLTEKLFLLHRLLFIPYFNNPQGEGEGRGGGYSQWWPLRPILPQKECNEKLGISLPEEYERLQGILSFRFVLWPKSATKGFYGAVKKSSQFSCFVVYSWGKWAPGKVHLQQFKEGTAKFQTRYVKGVPFVNERYTKGVPFLLKMIYRRVRGWTSKRWGWGGGSLPEKSFVKYLFPGL